MKTCTKRRSLREKMINKAGGSATAGAGCEGPCQHAAVLEELLPALRPLLKTLLLTTDLDPKTEYMVDRLLRLTHEAHERLGISPAASEIDSPCNKGPASPSPEGLTTGDGCDYMRVMSCPSLVAMELAHSPGSSLQPIDEGSVETPKLRAVDVLNKRAMNMRKVVKDLTTMRMVWSKTPKRVLVIKKWNSPQISMYMKSMVAYLTKADLTIYVEPSVFDEEHIFEKDVLSNLQCFDQDDEAMKRSIDLIVCLGGDGTILYVSSLFQEYHPPVLSFHLGSLGFLTPFEFRNYKKYIQGVLNGGFSVTLRMRMQCSIQRAGPRNGETDHDTIYLKTRTGETPRDTFLALNEVVVDRGPSPYLSTLDLYVDGRHITSVQADGVIVATPTGSTAYSLSAGGSMAHPTVPGILVTPICPHTLSFRPLILPESIELKIVVQEDSRNDAAWVSCDGRNRQQIRRGDTLTITCSPHYVPTIAKHSQSHDWFDSLNRCLAWNTRGHVHGCNDPTGSSQPIHLTIAETNEPPHQWKP